MIHTIKKLNQEIKSLVRTGKEVGGISDGYHTFDELYGHRVALFIALCNMIHEKMGGGHGLPWKSTQHHDGTMFEGGWFIAGITFENGEQISYHLPLKDWNKLRVDELKTAPVWDGHTSADVVERLLKL